MSILLGVDTGGTYTDAVLIEHETRVLASAKALTTRDDLARGIGEAVSAVLRDAAVDPARVAMAALSTTLATNAVVEGQGGRVALVLIGFRERDLDISGLREALGGDPVLICAGGHDHAGDAVAPLDEAALRAFCESEAREVSAFAVAGQFATRNAAHELRAAEVIAEVSACPVSASHQLSSKLGGPKRALTALLNARLIGMIDRLIRRAETRLSELGIAAPLMVVRGDGALISAEEARRRPIETILSGPAASLVGARWLTGIEDALVSDIGGTTTDVAILRGGRPEIDPDGARVGGFRTMVEAVAMETTGLGGDSAVHLVPRGLETEVVLGPQRSIPVALLAMEAPEAVHAVLDAQLRATAPAEHHGRFLRAVPGQAREGLGPREADLMERLGSRVAPVEDFLRARLEWTAVQRLVRRGLVQLGGVTPSDAAHVLGSAVFWDAAAAEKALRLMARQRDGAGTALAGSSVEMAEQVRAALIRQTVRALLEVALAAEGFGAEETPAALARHVLLARGLAGHRGFLRLDAGLELPLVGLGASAATYYPAVGAQLNTRVEVPEHAGVANAIGAVVGQVRVRRSGSVTAPAEGRFRSHAGAAAAPRDFASREDALAHLELALQTQATEEAAVAGATDLQVAITREMREAAVEGRRVTVEVLVAVEVTGRPPIVRR